MPSTQVTMVIETEKKAAGIELDARTKAQELLDAAKETAASNRRNIDKSTDTIIEDIKADAEKQAEVIQNTEENASAVMISALHAAAGQHKPKAIQAAVNILTGKT